MRQNYTAMIENIDRHTGRILDAIESRGELENTIVVYSSDHGEMLGDHNCWEKSNFYDGALRVPLVIAGPGIDGGRVSDALAQVNDLGPTFLDLAGAEPLGDSDGLSLRPVLEGRARGVHDYSYSGLNQRGSRGASSSYRVIRVTRFDVVCDGRYKLVVDHTEGRELLFDGKIDPHELTNIVDSEPEVADRLRSALARQTSPGAGAPVR
ncbi:MAG: sulfatase-like hydrolase/transferase [Chloroflexi bacterium]|nr:sulfatase-like hydrolase/transferase [Chloroflexota bacterium]